MSGIRKLRRPEPPEGFKGYPAYTIKGRVGFRPLDLTNSSISQRNGFFYRLQAHLARNPGKRLPTPEIIRYEKSRGFNVGEATIRALAQSVEHYNRRKRRPKGHPPWQKKGRLSKKKGYDIWQKP